MKNRGARAARTVTMQEPAKSVRRPYPLIRWGVGAALLSPFVVLPASAAAAESPNPEQPVLGPASEAELQEARRQWQSLQDGLATLKSELETERTATTRAVAQSEKQAAEAAAAQATLTARVRDLENPKPLAPRVSALSEGLRLSGFAQIDYVARQSSLDEVNSSTGEPLNENRFSLRRSRLKLTMERGYVAGLLELDANTVKGPQVRPVGFEATVRWPSTTSSGEVTLPLMAATMGQFKIPFGFEVLQSDVERLFAERSTVVRALFPGEFDVGARLAGGWRFVRYAVAVQNGEPLGEKSFPGRDPNNAKDVTGRVGVTFEDAHPVAGAAGISALVGKGFHKGTPATKPSVFWQDRNENGVFESGELQVSSGTAGQASSNFRRHAFGVDGRAGVDVPVLGRFTLGGEVIWGKNLDRAIAIADPVSSGRDIRELGFNVFALQEIGPHLVFGFRFDSYDPDRDSTDVQQATVIPASTIYRTWAFAAAVQSKTGRLIAEYDVNRNHNGRDQAGLSTNLADNAFTLRGEVRF